MVAWLWLLDTIHQALVIKAMYGIFVSRFGDVAALALIPHDFIAEIIFTVLVSSTAQLFFTYRIWLFSGKKWIFPFLAIPIVIGQIVIQSVYMAALLVDNTLPTLVKINPLAIAYNTIAASSDVALAACMVYLLRAERSGFDSSDQLVGKLVLFSLNSGLWTALVALATVITLVGVPLPDLIFPAVYTMLCPLYCNTVMANLNSRKFLQQSNQKNQSTPSQPGNVALETFSRRAPQKNVITIQVDTTQATDQDSLQEMHDRKTASDRSFA
jgi:hypothetical protein